MKIAIASDHGGFALKEALKPHLSARGAELLDCGTDSTESCDYIDFAVAACHKVQQGEVDCAVLVCGTGVGISIAANKLRGIRCGVCPSPEVAALVKQHNNANAIALGGRTTDLETAKAIVDAYLDASFEGGRHQKRIDKITALETPTKEES